MSQDVRFPIIFELLCALTVNSLKAFPEGDWKGTGRFARF